ncbi:recombination-associated protein RdgC [Vibrio sp. D431a]|uniref:recombination-associated protein RdgC n=1 Tax=Vibrio sp. D431a TaxID=2837388 RepID=UPI0025559BB3|nr:recombination-associated protein RdgC [Vibrio sp. D431a]MDK9793889.1 recombination-associated protein RdgC [Vibrio sp. D431a]
MFTIISCINFDSSILSKEELLDLIEKTHFKKGKFGNSESLRMGFTKLVSSVDNTSIESTDGNYVLTKFLIGQKKVKPSTIEVVAEERLEEIKRRDPEAKLKTVKEQVKVELIGQAMPEYVDFWVLFDFKNNLVYTNKGGKNYENFISHVKNHSANNPFGSYLKPSLITESEKLNTWLSSPDALPEGLTLGSAVDLENTDGSKGKFKDIEIETSEAVENFMNNGGFVKSLNLHLGQKVSFNVSDKGEVKGISPLAYTQERIDDYLGEDGSEEPLAELQVRTQISAMDLFEIIKRFYSYE